MSFNSSILVIVASTSRQSLLCPSLHCCRIFGILPRKVWQIQGWRCPVCSVNVQFQVHRFLLPLFYCSTQGNSSHNTCYEYFFKYLKKEETNRKCYHSLQELQLSIFEYIKGYYNSKRPHSIYLLQTKQKLSIRSRICKAVPDYFFTFLSTSLTVL